MRETTRRPLLLTLLVLSALLAVWVIARASGPGPTQAGSAVGSPGPAATATVGADPAQRHTASSGASESATDPVSGLPWIAESALPAEARDTLALIAAGGPFPYPRNDNQTFQNRERLLPVRPRGYYREFTVETPGSDDRGARRIVTGADDETYWTADHYDSFSRVREGT